MSEAIIQIVGCLDDFINLCVEEEVTSVEVTLKTLKDQQGKPYIVDLDALSFTVPVVLDYVGATDTIALRHRQKVAEAYYKRITEKKKDSFGPLQNQKRLCAQAEYAVKAFHISWHDRLLQFGKSQTYTLRYYHHIFPAEQRILHTAPSSFEIPPSLLQQVQKPYTR